MPRQYFGWVYRSLRIGMWFYCASFAIVGSGFVRADAAVKIILCTFAAGVAVYAVSRLFLLLARDHPRWSGK